MKKTLSTLLIGTLVLASVTACGQESGNAQPKTQKSITQKPTAAAMPTAENEPPASGASIAEQFMSEPIVDRQIIDRTNKDVIALMDSYKSILYSESELIDSSNKESMTIDQLINSFGTKVEITKFAIIDLDSDNLPEIVLALTPPTTDSIEFFTILHTQGSAVYSYSFTYRGFYPLKIDGTYVWANSASNQGASRIAFTEDKDTGYPYTTDEFLYCDITDINKAEYTIEHQNVTAEEWNKAMDYQDSKPNVTWYDFTKNSIEKNLS